jgi:hypothetical protein
MDAVPKPHDPMINPQMSDDLIRILGKEPKVGELLEIGSWMLTIRKAGVAQSLNA